MSHCPVCSSTHLEPWCVAWDDQYFTSSGQFTYRRCQDCHTVFIDPMPVDRLAEIYPPNYYAYAPRSKNPVVAVKGWLDRRKFRGILGRLGGPQLKVLDVGGGSGWQLDLLRALDRRITVTCEVDLDEKGAAIARHGGHEVFCGRIEDFQTPHRFDLVLMLNLIEHVPNPVEIMQKAGSLLAPGGMILVQTPNYDSLDARLFRHHNWGGYHCPRHFVLFTAPDFAALCTRAGLRVVHQEYTQGAPFWAWTCLGWLQRRGLVSLSAARPSISHPLFPPLCAAFAAFDLLRRPFSRTSQMCFLLAQAAARP